MVHLYEVKKLREAQRREEEENWSGSDGWDQDRGSQSPDNRDSDSRSRGRSESVYWQSTQANQCLCYRQ
jgi:hypothetical protein